MTTKFNPPEITINSGLKSNKISYRNKKFHSLGSCIENLPTARGRCCSDAIKDSQPNLQKNCKLDKVCCKTNQNLCRIPGHGIQGLGCFFPGACGLRPIDLSPSSWQTHLGLGNRVPVFCTYRNLHNMKDDKWISRIYSPTYSVHMEMP